MNSKDYLQQAYIIDKQIRLDLQKLEAMKASLHGRAISYDSDGTRSASRKNVMEDSIIRAVDYEQRINTEIEMLTKKRSEIENDIISVPDEILREVLTRRYLLYQKWEQIAEEMNYGVRHIYKLHSKALKAFPEKAS